MIFNSIFTEQVFIVMFLLIRKEKIIAIKHSEDILQSCKLIFFSQNQIMGFLKLF